MTPIAKRAVTNRAPFGNQLTHVNGSSHGEHEQNHRPFSDLIQAGFLNDVGRNPPGHESD